MVEVLLGRFGDRRLEKGGSFCMTVWSVRAITGCGYGGWAAGVLERFA